MKEIDHPPFAPSLMESMRSMGYSLGSALSDLVDNSITATAGLVEILFNTEDSLHVAVLDNGCGMKSRTLEEAMRHGSRNPDDAIDESDLGRFGLGLKTASLSQCRRVTVVSLRDRTLSAYCWDLDVVRERRKWALLQLEASEIDALQHVDQLQKLGKGTLVLWEKLDRLLAGASDISSEMGTSFDEARDHLALVFHRYLQGERGLRRLTLRINGLDVSPADPFLLEHSLTQKLEDDEFRIEGKRVRIKPFILPHPSRLSPSEAKLAGGQEGFRSQQGFYIYRQKRLIIWGNWFRLARKDELSRLARVRVDIPNSLDHLWTLDIRKSVANPPEVVRQQLRRTVEKIRERSRVTHENRGHSERRGTIERGWVRIYSSGSVRYDVNREHAAMRTFREQLSPDMKKQFDSLLRVIETSFPVESLYVDVAAEQRVSRLPDAKGLLLNMATDLLSGLPQGSMLKTALLANLHNIEPFSAHPQIARDIAKELV